MYIYTNLYMDVYFLTYMYSICTKYHNCKHCDLQFHRHAQYAKTKLFFGRRLMGE